MALEIHVHALSIVQARDHPTTGARFLQRSEEELLPQTKHTELSLAEYEPIVQKTEHTYMQSHMNVS